MFTYHKIRPAEERLVRELDEACLPDTYFEGVTEGNHHWLVESWGIPVAFASLRETTTDPKCIFLSRSGVLPAARGYGIQKRLIEIRLRWAKRSGYHEAVTYAGHGNSASIISLLKSGMVMYDPDYRWAGDEFVYFHKPLRP